MAVAQRRPGRSPQKPLFSAVKTGSKKRQDGESCSEGGAEPGVGVATMSRRTWQSTCLDLPLKLGTFYLKL